MTTGRRLYDEWRRHEPDSVHWNWLDAETRDFWDRVARMVTYR